MNQLYEIAGQVMGFFDAFKGSRPAINNNGILIVRGRSRTVLPVDEFDNKLSEIGEIIGGTEVDPKSNEALEILKSSDEHIKIEEGETPSIDGFGLSRMKKELESLGLVVEYKIFTLPKCDVIIAIWEDKNGFPPLYVEVTVSAKMI